MYLCWVWCGCLLLFDGAFVPVGAASLEICFVGRRREREKKKSRVENTKKWRATFPFTPALPEAITCSIHGTNFVPE